MPASRLTGNHPAGPGDRRHRRRAQSAPDLCHPGVLRAILESDPVAESLSEALFPLLREDVPGRSNWPARARPARRDAQRAAPAAQPVRRARGAEAGAPRTAAVARRGGGAGRAAGADRCDARHGIQHRPADVGGYGYHSGVKFALYAEGWRDALVSGGRYDDVSRAFGRARPATGFSLDLRKLAAGLPPAERLARCARPGPSPP